MNKDSQIEQKIMVTSEYRDLVRFLQAHYETKLAVNLLDKLSTLLDTEMSKALSIEIEKIKAKIWELSYDESGKGDWYLETKELIKFIDKSEKDSK